VLKNYTLRNTNRANYELSEIRKYQELLGLNNYSHKQAKSGMKTVSFRKNFYLAFETESRKSKYLKNWAFTFHSSDKNKVFLKTDARDILC